MRAARRYARKNGSMLDDRMLKFLKRVGSWSNNRATRLTTLADDATLKPSIHTEGYTNTKGYYGLRVKRDLIKDYIRAWKKTTNNAKTPNIDLYPSSYFSEKGISPNFSPGWDGRPWMEVNPNWQVIAHETGHAINNTKSGDGLANYKRKAIPTILEELKAWKSARKLLGNTERWGKADKAFKDKLYDTQRSALEGYKNSYLRDLIQERFLTKG